MDFSVAGMVVSFASLGAAATYGTLRYMRREKTKPVGKGSDFIMDNSIPENRASPHRPINHRHVKPDHTKDNFEYDAFLDFDPDAYDEVAKNSDFKMRNRSDALVEERKKRKLAKSVNNTVIL